MTALRSDVAFTPAVKEAQRRRGSREAYARHLAHRDWSSALPAPLVAFVASRDMFFLGTASAAGQPYIQHRGGQPGFLTVLDPTTLAFADYAGNRQYISVGNLSENPKVSLFLLDQANRRRLKIWGRAEVVEAPGPELAEVMAASAGERVERVVVVHIEAWDLNCPQHITPRYTAEEWAARAAP